MSWMGRSVCISLRSLPLRYALKERTVSQYLVGASKLGIHIVEVAGTQGKPFSKAIEWLEQNRFEVVVSKFGT